MNCVRSAECVFDLFLLAAKLVLFRKAGLGDAKRQSGEREAYWREQVRRQASSGLSVRRFCEDAGLSEPSFYAWRRRLVERDGPAPGSEFLPVILTPHMASSGSRITIELRGGRLMHLPETVAPERIVALLRGLEADSTQDSEVTP